MNNMNSIPLIKNDEILFAITTLLGGNILTILFNWNLVLGPTCHIAI